jgi:hypothetical protein
MANTNRSYGFIPFRHLCGGVIRTNEYQIATSGTTGFNDDIFQGAPVALNTDGTIELAVAGSLVMVGIFDGCRYYAADGSVVFSPRWPASTAVLPGSTITAYVYDDPFITYKVKCATGVAFTQAMVGANADHVGTSGSTTTNRSTARLDLTSLVATTAGWRILRLIPEPGNTYGDSADVEVFCNESVYRTTAGV